MISTWQLSSHVHVKRQTGCIISLQSDQKTIIRPCLVLPCLPLLDLTLICLVFHYQTLPCPDLDPPCSAGCTFLSSVHLQVTSLIQWKSAPSIYRIGNGNGTCCFLDFVQMRGGGCPCPNFWHLFLSAFLVNNRSLLPPECQ